MQEAEQWAAELNAEHGYPVKVETFGPPPPPPVLSTGTDQSSPPAGATAKVVATPPSDARAPWRIKQDETQESVNRRKRAAAAAADLEAAKGKPSESSA